MSRFFEQQEETKELLAPDYSEAECPKEDDDDEENSITDIDETQEDEIINSKEEEKKVVTTSTFGTQATPFGNPVTSSTPTWGTQTATTGSTTPFTTPTWGTGATTPPQNVWTQQQNNTTRPTWGTTSSTGTTWGTGSSTTSMNGKVEIDRSKKVIVTDFLDVIVETLQSNGSPGLIPRDIYDLRQRIDVWAKFLAYSPERVYILAPINLLMGTSGSPLSWQSTLNYFSICLASFLRIPYQSCPVIALDMIGVRKADIVKPLISGINPKDVVMVGVNSGLYGQSNIDSMSAMECGIDYVDLTALLNNMY